MITVKLHTNLGSITLELDEKNNPITTQNFIDYIESEFYKDTIFHRVIDGFVIQGGGLTADMQEKPNNAPIKNEAKFGLSNKAGTIAMARTSDPNSATSQFFINLKDNNFLDFKAETIDGYGYCAFGKVTEGMEVVEKISHVNTVNRAGHQDVPETDVVLEKAEIITEKSTVN